MKIQSLKPPKRGPKGRVVEPQALAEVQALLADGPRRADLLIEYLHRIHDHYRQLSSAHVAALAQELKLAQAEVYEVASFYHHFEVVKPDAAGVLPEPASLTIRVCNGLSCQMAGASALLQQLQAKYHMPIRVIEAPCIGRCEQAPAVCVGQHAFGPATLEQVTQQVQPRADAVPGAAPATPLPDGHFSASAYGVLARCLSGQRDAAGVIEQLSQASLRGLGGAGFPTGRKWKIVSQATGPRLMAVNIDEGEPGTFKDRYYLENEPQAFLEGLLLASWAVGISAVYIYLRDEYHALRNMLQAALLDLPQQLAPLLATAANPQGWALPEIHLRRGAGAYICGEESAMIESIEGKRGLPRLRPPYVAEVGLFNRPTLVQNLETLCWVPKILRDGADSFAGHGRNGRKGLRSFSVSGRVVQPGVHLAPAGISLTELIDEYCGGMLPGHTLYGYLPGGASGGIFPARLAHVPLDFDTLQEHGGFIGSAAVVVLSQHDKARDAALNTLEFFKHESCGQCTPCRAGCDKAVTLLKAPSWDVPLLTELGQVMMDASICGLGQAAPNPFLSVIKYFPDEVK
jgi:formate dehydrogenase